ncbi:DivIVA domain-containing protein [Micromonospora sp. NBC_01813]|uniref:DivIVA domain-containing protein n=1 Tax=Micromonospora sp. NBC_01813 TaxID=2975988 RepID=UPI002DDC7EAB|nr:DivIVA domain-containing protein [Micromonospora sp. NBC_01813]WSA09106.1 DivIVA domain-containing protein [Micromonospora sp. NBC_01813]
MATLATALATTHNGRHTATPPRDWPNGSGVYRLPDGRARNQRPGAYRPIRPWQIRAHHFPTLPRRARGRGLDPADVAAFLDRVAHDLGILYAELDRTIEQNDRIKDALRRWQTTQALAAQATVNLPTWAGTATATAATRFAGQS